MRIKTFTVRELNHYIAKSVNSNPLFFHVSVRGEVVNLKTTRYGYIFFSLKDEESKINCIIMEAESSEPLEEGTEISLKGKVHVYEKNGTYSILVKEFSKIGKGNAYENYLKTKEELERLGYFDEKYKKMLPEFPEKIGIITSARGAVIRDLVSVISRRYPLVVLKVFDVRVQGEEAEQDLIKGIRYFEQAESVDLMILARGGGSYDELSIFNSKELAIEIFRSKTPIVSAVGHESDFFISDLVADLRASTPSAAAELCVPELSSVQKRCLRALEAMKRILKGKIRSTEISLLYLERTLQSKDPVSKIRDKKRRAEELCQRLRQQMNGAVFEVRRKADIGFLKLSALDPAQILQRGYAVVEKDGRIISDIRNVRRRDLVKTRISNSYFISEIIEIGELEEKFSEKK